MKLCWMLCGSLEESLGENGYMCMYSWVLLLFIWNYHNMVCLSAILKYKIKSLKKSALDTEGNEMPLKRFWQRPYAWKDSILESSLWLLWRGRIRQSQEQMVDQMWASSMIQWRQKKRMSRRGVKGQSWQGGDRWEACLNWGRRNMDGTEEAKKKKEFLLKSQGHLEGRRVQRATG